MLGHQFGVPLYAQEKGMPLKFRRFDEAVIGSGDWQEALCHDVQRLMMFAVDRMATRPDAGSA